MILQIINLEARMHFLIMFIKRYKEHNEIVSGTGKANKTVYKLIIERKELNI